MCSEDKELMLLAVTFQTAPDGMNPSMPWLLSVAVGHIASSNSASRMHEASLLVLHFFYSLQQGIASSQRQ